MCIWKWFRIICSRVCLLRGRRFRVFRWRTACIFLMSGCRCGTASGFSTWFEKNQWRSSQKVIDWFNTIENKNAYTFTIFDIKDFHPSIKEALLLEALNFAGTLIKMDRRDVDTIRHARKSLLFDSSSTRIKQNGGLFDVTMGAFDGADRNIHAKSHLPIGR